MDPVVELTLRATLALLFGTTAAHKLADRARFRATLADYRLLPAGLVPGGALAATAGEIAVALALVVPGLEKLGLAAAAVLLVVYGVAMAVNLARGRRDLDCGCAGPAARRPISGWLVARNAVLAGAALAGLLPVAARPLTWIDGVTVLAATSALSALYAACDRLLAQVPTIARLRSAT